MNAWSRSEVEMVVSEYFEMLKMQLSDLSFNKSAHRRKIMPLLNNRSDKSIEYKFGNISAVLIQLGRTYITGYKPYWNYQALLRDVILDRIDELESLSELMTTYNEQEIQVDSAKVAFNKWIVSRPVPNVIREPMMNYGTIKRNYIEEEQRNQSIGLSGEKLVLEYEKWRLAEKGKFSLAKKIEWVSKEQGDGAGFDILSKNEDGSDRFIEVKSTTLGKETPIFFTRRENEFSKSNAEQFHLYRVFELKRKPKMFQCHGAFSAFCHDIEPMTFKGVV